MDAICTRGHMYTLKVQKCELKIESGIGGKEFDEPSLQDYLANTPIDDELIGQVKFNYIDFESPIELIAFRYDDIEYYNDSSANIGQRISRYDNICDIWFKANSSQIVWIRICNDSINIYIDDNIRVSENFTLIIECTLMASMTYKKEDD